MFKLLEIFSPWSPLQDIITDSESLNDAPYAVVLLRTFTNILRKRFSSKSSIVKQASWLETASTQGRIAKTDWKNQVVAISIANNADTPSNSMMQTPGSNWQDKCLNPLITSHSNNASSLAYSWGSPTIFYQNPSAFARPHRRWLPTLWLLHNVLLSPMP